MQSCSGCKAGIKTTTFYFPADCVFEAKTITKDRKMSRQLIDAVWEKRNNYCQVGIRLYA